MFEVTAQWDEETRVWYATSEDVPGLCVQADTFDELVDIATTLAPELLKDNQAVTTGEVQLHITAERLTMAKAA